MNIRTLGGLALVLLATIQALGSEKEVFIGLASNFTEVSSSSSNPFGGYFKDGITLALRDSEKRLRSRGIKISFREFDYGNSDARVLEAAKKAASSDVIAVLGYNFSSHALLAAAIHQKYELPMITPSATANRIGSVGPFVHQGCFDNAFMGETLARVARRRLKAKSAAIVAAVDCAYCTDLAQAFEKEFKRHGGAIAVSAPVLQDDTNFESMVAKLKNQNFDVVLIPNQELSSARIISALLASGVRKPFLGGDGWGNVGEEFFGILGKKDLSGYSVSHWHPAERSKESVRFITDYRREFKKEPNDTSVLAYDSMRLLVDAILSADSFTRKDIEQALVRIKTFSGVTGNFLFRTDRAPIKSLVLLAANNSKFKVLERIEPTGAAR